MVRRSFIYLLILFQIFSFKEVEASSAFTRTYHHKNVSIDCGQVYSDRLTPHILGFSLAELIKALHKEQLNIVINHNTDQPYNGFQFPNKTSYHWAVKYGSRSLKRHELVKLEKPSIIIYYSGEFSIEKYKAIVYYAINHIDEIRAKQKLIDLPFYGHDKDTAVADHDIDIPTTASDKVNKILGYRELFIGDIYGTPNITYSYLKGTFNIIYYEGILKRAFDPYKPVKGRKLLKLSNVYQIITLPHDYLIYESKHTFYDINRDNMSVSGPHTEPDYEKFFQYDYWGDNHRYARGDRLINSLSVPDRGGIEDTFTIVFDRKTKEVTSTYIAAWLNRGFWPESPYHRRSITYSPPTQQPITPRKKIPGYILLFALALNSTFILLSAKRNI